MSHSSGITHPSSQSPGSNPSHSSGHSHRNIIQQFADGLNGNHLNNLDKYRDRARDYYTKEHQNKKTAHWKIVNNHDDDGKGNTIRARLYISSEYF